MFQKQQQPQKHILTHSRKSEEQGSVENSKKRSWELASA